MWNSLKENGRTLRATVAVAAIVALAVLFVAQRGEVNLAKERAMQEVSANSWKVSELVFESQRLSLALRLQSTGEVKRTDVQRRFDLLWSRVDVLEQTNVGDTPEIRSLLQRYREFLGEREEVIFERPIIAPRDSIVMARELTELSGELRVIWIDTFQGRDFAEVTLGIGANARSVRVQALIVALMAFLVLYVIAEIIFAGIAQRRERQLSRAAAQANEAKTRFLANVSHEIRTPLNGILGMNSELADSNLNPDQRACVTVIRQSGELLLNTLNDVLDLSKVEAGAIVIENRQFDIGEALNTAQALYRGVSRDKGLRFEVEISPDIPQMVVGDATRLRQILHNLISDAIKFTAHGTVRLSAEMAPAEGRIRFSVKDTGPGIAIEAQKTIFQPFTQADASITRKHGGTGLGLTISGQLVRAMGSELRVNSILGHGAEFWFDLPLPAVAPKTQATTKDTPTEVSDGVVNLRVLVVDDNSTNRMILRRFLKNTGGRVEEANDGAEAVTAVTGGEFDVILMDIQMPVMDGIEATKRIREMEIANDRPPTHIIAVTANVMEHQVQDYLGHGMNDVIGKPVSKKALISRLADLGPGDRPEVNAA